jgi:hypothetical protein
MYVHTYTTTYIHTHTHTYIYVHTYIHTYTYTHQHSRLLFTFTLKMETELVFQALSFGSADSPTKFSTMAEVYWHFRGTCCFHHQGLRRRPENPKSYVLEVDNKWYDSGNMYSKCSTYVFEVHCSPFSMPDWPWSHLLKIKLLCCREKPVT